ncbi:hypothetical protein Bca4012_043718 [Brassica carinata]
MKVLKIYFESYIYPQYRKLTYLSDGSGLNQLKLYSKSCGQITEHMSFMLLQRMNDSRWKSRTEPVHGIKAGRLLEKCLTADQARLWSTSIVVFIYFPLG